MPKTLLIYAAGNASADGTYLAPIGGGVGNANEVDAQILSTNGALFSNLRCWVSAGGSGDNAVRFRKNSEDGNQVAAGTGTGVVSDTTHTDTVVPGDVFTLKLNNTGTNPTYRWVSVNCELDGAHGSYHGAGNFSGTSIFDVASATRFIPIHGFLPTDGHATEATCQWKVRGYTSISAFQVRVTANARLNDTVFKLRLNGADIAASTLTVETLTTGLFVASDLNVALSPGDLLCASITTLAGTEDITLSVVGVTLLSSSNASELWCAVTNPGNSRTASETASFYTPGGSVIPTTTLTDLSVTPGFPADIKNLRIYLADNTYAANATLALMVNDVAVMTTTIPAAATGWLENTSDTVTITATDKVCLRIVGGTSGSITIHAMGFTLWVPAPVNPSVNTKPRYGTGLGPGPKTRNHPWPQFCLVNP